MLDGHDHPSHRASRTWERRRCAEQLRCATPRRRRARLPFTTEDRVRERVEAGAVGLAPGLHHPPLRAVAASLEHALHRTVVAAGRRLDTVEFREGVEEVVGEPSERGRADAPPTIGCGEAEVDQRTAVDDVIEVVRPDEADRAAVVAHPEPSDIVTGDRNRRGSVGREARLAVERPLVRHEELHRRCRIAFKDGIERERHIGSLA